MGLQGGVKFCGKEAKSISNKGIAEQRHGSKKVDDSREL